MQQLKEIFFVIFIILLGTAPSFAKLRSSSKIEREVKKSQKAMWLAHVLRERSSKKIIKDLSVVQAKVPVFLVPQGETFKPLVKLSLKMKGEGWVLYDVNGDKLRFDEGSEKYSVYAYLKSRISTLTVVAKGANGEKEREKFFLFAPEAREFKTATVFDSIQFSLGHTYLVYKQTTFGKYTSQALLVGARYVSPERGYRLGFYGDIWSTIYTYNSSPIDRGANFLEARLGLSYSQKIFRTPKSRTRFLLGMSNIDLVSLGGNLGFKGLFGPNLGMRTEYYRSGKNSFVTELQFTPYEFDKILEERSIKLSLDWVRNLNNLRRMSFGLSYSDNSFNLGVEKVSADVLSVYFSLSF